MKNRIEIYNPICDYYENNPKADCTTLQSEWGYQYNATYGGNNWMAERIFELKKIGYTEGKYHNGNGGDNDFLVIDHKNKKFEFGENGDLQPKEII
jgi:hypothetical protein